MLTEQLYQGGMTIMTGSGLYFAISSICLLFVKIILQKKLNKEYGRKK